MELHKATSFPSLKMGPKDSQPIGNKNGIHEAGAGHLPPRKQKDRLAMLLPGSAGPHPPGALRA